MQVQRRLVLDRDRRLLPYFCGLTITRAVAPIWVRQAEWLRPAITFDIEALGEDSPHKRMPLFNRQLLDRNYPAVVAELKLVATRRSEGRELSSQQAYRFHNQGSYLSLLQTHAPHIEPTTKIYVREAISALYSGNVLVSTVMLGVAAESDFLRLADAAANHPTHGSKFQKMAQQRSVSQKMDKFGESVRLLKLPHSIAESLDTHFSAIQTIIRIARNDSGHPTGIVPAREDTHLYMQLFIPYARLVGQLRQFFN